MSLMPLVPIVLLLFSNIFMTAAWYGHLKYPHAPMLVAIFASWGIALVEYSMAVPANRIGVSYFTVAQLKTIQEVITLLVFVVFSVLYLGEKITSYHLAGFALIGAGAALIFMAPK